MKKTKILALLLATLMIFAMFAGCGKTTDAPANNDAQQTTAQAPDASENDTTAEAEEDNAPVDNDPIGDLFAEGLSAKKIASTDIDRFYSFNGKAVVYYGDNDLYGLMSHEGKVLTDAIYADVETQSDFYIATKTDPATMDIDDVSTLNTYGLLNAEGDEIIPFIYANIEVLNEYCAQVFEVTEQTDSEDDMLMFYTDSMFAMSADEDDILFKGTWYLYDLTTGKKVDGVSGTKGYSAYAYKDIVKYVTDAKEYAYVNLKGETIPDEADIFENGCYALETDETAAVYTADGKKLFNYDPDGMTPTSSTGDYIIGYDYDESSKYVLMDMDGNIVSGEFPSSPAVDGGLVFANYTLCNMDGSVVIEGSYEYSYIDDLSGQAFVLRNGNDCTLIDANGTVMYQGTKSDTLDIDYYSYFTICNKTDNERMYYCFADKDFTIKGSAVAPWLVESANEDGTADIIDTLSGKTIISGYKDYSIATVDGECLYVYAKNADNTRDIYIVK